MCIVRELASGDTQQGLMSELRVMGKAAALRPCGYVGYRGMEARYS
jgi:hypothetical protein